MSQRRRSVNYCVGLAVLVCIGFQMMHIGRIIKSLTQSKVVHQPVGIRDIMKPDTSTANQRRAATSDDASGVPTEESPKALVLGESASKNDTGTESTYNESAPSTSRAGLSNQFDLPVEYDQELSNTSILSASSDNATSADESNVSEPYVNSTVEALSTNDSSTSSTTSDSGSEESEGEQNEMGNETSSFDETEVSLEQQRPVADVEEENDEDSTSIATNNTVSEDEADASEPLDEPYWTDEDQMLATLNRSTVYDFDRQDRVVIATKVQGDQEYQIADVKQSMCLLNAAYNNRVHYDIVVFTSTPWNETDVTELEAIVAPAKVKIVMDSLPLPEVVRAMSETGRQKLLNRCYNVSTPDDFHWHMECDDGKLRYNWQAEFRTKHVWTNPALDEYKYMLWMDSDGHAGAKWNKDPIATMIRNDLVLLFDNFPGGTSRDKEVRERIYEAFNTTDHCGIDLEDGHLVTHKGTKCVLKQVHGFFHVTNLDFYRSAPVQRWVNTLIGDDHYRRAFDDQIGITVPAAILAPTQSWDMYSHDIELKVVHNRFFDGKRGQLAKGYIKYWERNAAESFPEAFGTCDPYIKSQGRRYL